MFTVKLVDRSFSPIATSHLRFSPKRWSGNVWGGMEHAEISVAGKPELLEGLLDGLRYGVTIHNENGHPVWWGYVDEVQLNIRSTTAVLTLDQLANKVQVKYSYETGDGLVDGVTDWQEDSRSQTTFGIKELREEAADTTVSGALEKAKRSLAKRKKPVGAPAPKAQQNKATATLTCRGWFDTLQWRYFEQQMGRIEHTPSSDASALLGWGFTSVVNFHAASKSIHQIDAYFAGLRSGDTVTVTGSASNNGVKTIVNAPSREDDDSYTATTISFASNDDIMDSAGGLAFIDSGEVIHVAGASVAANLGYHYVKTTGAEAIEISGSWAGNTGAESAGNSVTIRQGNHITVSNSVTNEVAPASVTITASSVQLAQRFTPTTTGNWLAGEIAIYGKRIGSPTDSLHLTLQNDAGGNIGSLIEAVNVTGSSITKDEMRIAFKLSEANTLNYGSAYWILLSRTGSNDNQNYYEINLSEESLTGSLLEWTGSTWQSRSPLAAMLHEVWGVRETTRQIQDIVTACAPLLRGTDVKAHSGVKERLYRKGDRWAIDEVIELLKSGYSDGRYLFAEVSQERFLRLYPSPSFSNDTALIWRDGRLFGQANSKIPKGALPFGQWMTLADFSPTANQMAQLSPVLLDSVEYDAESDQYTWTPYGAEDRYS